MFWVSEQRLVYQANTIRKNSWMTELEIDELERKVTESDIVLVEEAKSVEALPDHAGEDVRNLLPEMGAQEQTDSLDEQDVVKRKLQKLIALTISLLFGLVATMYIDMAAS